MDWVQCLPRIISTVAMCFPTSAMNYYGTVLDCGYRADLIVHNDVILELKSVEHILPLHEAQLLTCLRLSQCHMGLLLNCTMVSLKDGIRRRIL